MLDGVLVVGGSDGSGSSVVPVLGGVDGSVPLPGSSVGTLVGPSVGLVDDGPPGVTGADGFGVRVDGGAVGLAESGAVGVATTGWFDAVM